MIHLYLQNAMQFFINRCIASPFITSVKVNILLFMKHFVGVFFFFFSMLFMVLI